MVDKSYTILSFFFSIGRRLARYKDVHADTSLKKAWVKSSDSEHQIETSIDRLQVSWKHKQIT